MSDQRVKIAVWFERSEPGEYEVETLWATPEPEGYRLDNLPFYSKSLALGDVVSAARSADGMLEYRALVRVPGSVSRPTRHIRLRPSDIARLPSGRLWTSSVTGR